jgi:phosphocarrier protein
MIYKELVIKNKHGLHARPAAKFVRLANQFSSDILVESNGEQANGKSIMGLMVLGIKQGSVLKVTITGPDASSLLSAIEDVINNAFE